MQSSSSPIHANFVYCISVWYQYFESIHKIEHFLRLELDNFDCNFDILVRKNEKVTMEIKRQEVLAAEVFIPYKALFFEVSFFLGGVNLTPPSYLKKN